MDLETALRNEGKATGTRPSPSISTAPFQALRIRLERLRRFSIMQFPAHDVSWAIRTPRPGLYRSWKPRIVAVSVNSTPVILMISVVLPSQAGCLKPPACAVKAIMKQKMAASHDKGIPRKSIFPIRFQSDQAAELLL